MNPFLFDGHLDHEYRNLRDSTSFLSSSLLPPSAPSPSLSNSTTSFYHQQQHPQDSSPFDYSPMEDMVQSTWTIKPDQQQEEQMNEVEAGGGPSFETLGSLNARHRSLLRELINRQDYEATLGVVDGDQSLRHATELQALLVELSKETNTVLGGITVATRSQQSQMNGSDFEALSKLPPSRSESWSFLDSINFKAETYSANSQSYATSMTCFSDSDEGLARSIRSSQDTSSHLSDTGTSLSSSWPTDEDTNWFDALMRSQSNVQGSGQRLQVGDTSLARGAHTGFSHYPPSSDSVEGLVFGHDSTIAPADDDLLFEIESDGKYNIPGTFISTGFSPKTLNMPQYGNQPLIQSPQLIQQQVKNGREPRVAFSCDDCARMKKPCKKPLGPDGRIDPIGVCVRCSKNGIRFGKPVHCTYVKSHERILKSKHIHGLPEDTYTPDVG
ncbi:hypothetical protein BDY24DRAFT_400252 [Mrakia frigida]|uniref:uncharacterized protein n=1 Tax=Mrakia frigida TaxID=29902 RepID=UPI003FCC270E